MPILIDLTVTSERLLNVPEHCSSNDKLWVVLGMQRKTKCI